jgi:hypothetical protein
MMMATTTTMAALTGTATAPTATSATLPGNHTADRLSCRLHPARASVPHSAVLA